MLNHALLPLFLLGMPSGCGITILYYLNKEQVIDDENISSEYDLLGFSNNQMAEGGGILYIDIEEHKTLKSRVDVIDSSTKISEIVHQLNQKQNAVVDSSLNMIKTINKSFQYINNNKNSYFRIHFNSSDFQDIAANDVYKKLDGAYDIRSLVKTDEKQTSDKWSDVMLSGKKILHIDKHKYLEATWLNNQLKTKYYYYPKIQISNIKSASHSYAYSSLFFYHNWKGFLFFCTSKLHIHFIGTGHMIDELNLLKNKLIKEQHQLIIAEYDLNSYMRGIKKYLENNDSSIDSSLKTQLLSLLEEN